MIDFKTQSDDVEQIKNEITTKMEELKSVETESDWNSAISTLQTKFSDMQNSFATFNDSIIEFDEQDQDDARKFYSKMNNEIQTLETKFNELKKQGFQPKKPSLAEQFKDEKEPEMPPELANIRPEDQKVYPSNALQMDEVKPVNVPFSTDITAPLNPLEAGIETQEEDIRSLNCSLKKKVLLGLSVACVVIAAICLIIYLATS